MEVNKFLRGQIWWYENAKTYDGNVQGKTRPVIIISNNKANENSNNITVIPCTTEIKRLDMKTHIKFILNDKENISLCENILTINKNKLIEYIGTCNEELMKKFEYGLRVAIGLENVNTLELIERYNIEEEMKQKEELAEYKLRPPILEENKELSIQKPNIESKPKKQGRKAKYNYEDMARFLNDYETHNIDYLIKKYNEVSAKAVQNKVYRFRKILNLGA